MTIRRRTESGPLATRNGSLPPGQRTRSSFPRFAENPRTPPPPADDPVCVEMRAPGRSPLIVDAGSLSELLPHEQVSDFHCVTTWSHLDNRWGGVSMEQFWERVVVPWLGEGEAPRFVTGRAADGYRCVFLLEDLLAPGVMLATSLDGRPLDARHGAPLRIVSPRQYGFKNLKHLSGLDLSVERPRIGRLEHLRARVDLEERHETWPTWLTRRFYRLLIAPTAFVAERSLRRGEASRAPGPTRPR